MTVLERLVASVREQADDRLHATVARQVERADAALWRELSGLLVGQQSMPCIPRVPGMPGMPDMTPGPHMPGTPGRPTPTDPSPTAT